MQKHFLQEWHLYPWEKKTKKINLTCAIWRNTVSFKQVILRPSGSIGWNVPVQSEEIHFGLFSFINYTQSRYFSNMANFLCWPIYNVLFHETRKIKLNNARVVSKTSTFYWCTFLYLLIFLFQRMGINIVLSTDSY